MRLSAKLKRMTDQSHITVNERQALYRYVKEAEEAEDYIQRQAQALQRREETIRKLIERIENPTDHPEFLELRQAVPRLEEQRNALQRAMGEIKQEYALEQQLLRDAIRENREQRVVIEARDQSIQYAQERIRELKSEIARYRQEQSKKMHIMMTGSPQHA